MNILYSHLGTIGKDGWGRSFMMARSLAKLGHNVVFITTSKNCMSLYVKTINIDNVKVLVFPEILPTKLKSSGFNLLALFYKSIYSLLHKFDLTISDSGHRTTGIPCLINKYIYKSVYLSEWWDYFGEGGYYNSKSALFKIFYGRFEKWAEVKNKQIADGVIVLSSYMEQRAKSFGIINTKIIQGGSVDDIINLNIKINNCQDIIKIGYIGMDDKELLSLKPFIDIITNPNFRNKIKFITYGKKITADMLENFKLNGVIEEKGWINYLESTKELENIDLFLLLKEDSPIARAGWPNKLGDYIACGKPILISPYGDLVEFVNNNPEGFVTCSFSKESITNSLNDLLNNKYDLRMMSLANKKLSKKISWQNKAKEVVNFYFKIKNASIANTKF
jgi:glycosyltransferase involved in cell wall biosynthesis